MDKVSVTRNQAPRILILGIGSSFGDDRFGWEAAEALRHSALMNAIPPGRVEIAVLDRPGVMLLSHWRDAGAVILIDTVRSGSLPGSVHRLGLADLAGGKTVLSSHGFGVISALELGGALGELPAEIILYGIEMDPVCATGSMSPAVTAALPRLIRQLEKETMFLLGRIDAGCKANDPASCPF